MKKVLFCIGRLVAGGVQKIVLELSAFLSRSGVINAEILVLIETDSREEALLLDKYRDLNITFAFHGVQPTYLFRAPVLYKTMEKIQPDVIHSHSPIPHTYVGIAGKALGVPLVSTVHNTVLWRERWEKEKAVLVLNTFLDRMTDKYVAICKTAKENFINLVPVSEKKTVVIENFVSNVDEIENKVGPKFLERYHGICEGRFLFVNVAVLDVARKNQIRLVKAFGNLLRRRKAKARLLLLGDGPDYSRTKKTIEDEGMGGAISMMGFQRDVISIVKLSDCFVLPSLIEGVPVALLEALATGTPVLISEVGGMKGIVVEGGSGFTLNPLSENEIEKKLEAVYDMEKDKLESVGRAGKELVRKRYSIERSAREHLDLYGELLGRSL